MSDESVVVDAQYFYDHYIQSARNNAEIPMQVAIDFHQYVYNLGGDVRLLVIVAERLAREYARGIRCAVCCMTAAQSKAAGYNCTEDC